MFRILTEEDTIGSGVTPETQESKIFQSMYIGSIGFSLNT